MSTRNGVHDDCNSFIFNNQNPNAANAIPVDWDEQLVVFSLREKRKKKKETRKEGLRTWAHFKNTTWGEEVVNERLYAMGKGKVICND